MGYRVQHKVWLDLDTDIGQECNEIAVWGKQHRKFSQMFRDGIRLINSLAHGETALLEALFPQVVKRLVETHHAQELERLRREVADLRAQMTVTAVAPAAFHLPVVEDVPLEIREQSGEQASQNLFDQLMGML